MDPEFSIMATDLLRACAESRFRSAQTMVEDLAEMMPRDLKRNHQDIRLFWPYGLFEIPDLEYVAYFGQEIYDRVGVIAMTMYEARAARAELDLRKYPQ